MFYLQQIYFVISRQEINQSSYAYIFLHCLFMFVCFVSQFTKQDYVQCFGYINNIKCKYVQCTLSSKTNLIWLYFDIPSEHLHLCMPPFDTGTDKVFSKGRSVYGQVQVKVLSQKFKYQIQSPKGKKTGADTILFQATTHNFSNLTCQSRVKRRLFMTFPGLMSGPL